MLRYLFSFSVSGLLVNLLSRRTLIFLSSIMLSPVAISQTTPSEFAEMTLQDLFSESLTESTEESGGDTSAFRWSLQYRFAEYDGYRDGTSDLTLDEVLFVPGEEERTEKNFPVVPTVIKQRVTILNGEYQWRPDWLLSVALPYIYQETDHISIVPVYEEFSIKSNGIGDVTLGARYQFAKKGAASNKNHNTDAWFFGFGISLPTGSIDEQGDTPRAAGDQQLPYTMQLGSGTYDFPLELSYQWSGEYEYFLSASATLRSGKTDRDYRLGNRYMLAVKIQTDLSQNLKAIVGLDLVYIDKIHGRDEELLVPQAIPYPAGITNPNLYGGRKAVAKVGLKWRFAESYQITAEFGKPLYQDLNGPQPKEQWRTGFILSKLL